jgi:hypothetical protein
MTGAGRITDRTGRVWTIADTNRDGVPDTITAADPTVSGPGSSSRRPTADSAAAARNAFQFDPRVALLQQMLSQRLPPPSAPLANEPGLQFDDAHMTLDPNVLAQQLGLDEELGVDAGELDPLGEDRLPAELDVDQEQVEELGAELRVRVDGDDLDDDDLERLTALTTDERVAVLGTLD